MKQKQKSESHDKVMVFGEEVQTHEHRNNVVFGALLLLSGTILLLNSIGIIPWDFWSEIRKFWPLLLILWGLQIILGNNPLSKILSLLASLFVFGTAIIYVLQTKSPELLKYIPMQLIEWSNIWEVTKR